MGIDELPRNLAGEPRATGIVLEVAQAIVPAGAQELDRVAEPARSRPLARVGAARAIVPEVARAIVPGRLQELDRVAEPARGRPLARVGAARTASVTAVYQQVPVSAPTATLLVAVG